MPIIFCYSFRLYKAVDAYYNRNPIWGPGINYGGFIGTGMTLAIMSDINNDGALEAADMVTFVATNDVNGDGDLTTSDINLVNANITYYQNYDSSYNLNYWQEQAMGIVNVPDRATQIQLMRDWVTKANNILNPPPPQPPAPAQAPTNVWVGVYGTQLICYATSPDGGLLTYQWLYRALVNGQTYQAGTGQTCDYTQWDVGSSGIRMFYCIVTNTINGTSAYVITGETQV